jgi:ribosomal protein S6
MTEETKDYEIGFLLKSDTDREQLIKNLENSGFSVAPDGQISRIKLSYPIKKQNFAYFGYLYFSGNPAGIQGLSEKLKTEQNVLRFSIVPKSVMEKSGAEFSEGASLSRARRFSERQKAQEITIQPFAQQPVKKPVQPEVLSNEALEKKLEEILK